MMMRIFIAAVCALLLCGCTKKGTQYVTPNAKDIRESFSSVQESRHTIAQTEPPEEEPVVTPMVPFS